MTLGDNATVRLDADNEPQPDALLRIDAGGRSQINDDDWVESAPELIVEIAASSASYDLHKKLTVYRRNGVQEYLVWRVYNCELDWFGLRDGEYVQLEPNAEGIICSEVFPGLRWDKFALLAGDLARVLEVWQQGLAATCMMLNFVGAGSQTIIAHNLQYNKPAHLRVISHWLLVIG